MDESKKKEIAIFTICAVNFLSKALALADSVYRVEGINIVIYLTDKKVELKRKYDFATIKWIEDESIDNWKKYAFIYDVTEFSTCVKPLLARRLLATYSKVVFLDPDTCVYSNLSIIYKALDSYPILLTPHYTTPIELKESNYDLGMMRFGSFNLGFFAVSNSPEAKQFLDWWSTRCLDLGFFETQFGLSTDQKWVSIAPCFFPNLHVMFDLGLNVAFWNMHERTLTEHEDAYWVNGKYKLVFFHFSSFDGDNPLRISKRLSPEQKGDRSDFNKICEDYAGRIASFDNGYSRVEYGFSYMDDGEFISPTLRRAYACVIGKLGDIDPFQNNGEMKKFILMNHLQERKKIPYSPAGISNMSQHEKSFKSVYIIMRFLLRLLGPNQFMNFSRLLVYLSSYRQNEGLWKLPQ